MEHLTLGIDTSNYTSSVCILAEDDSIIADERKLLDVKKGERGLRQQEALFQHISNIPPLLSVAMKKMRKRHLNEENIKCVAASSRPRPIEGSYMPCFNAGTTIAKSLSATLGVPYYEFSHQEGHIAAVDPCMHDRFICYHLSGGTSELLEVSKRGSGYDINIIGATMDISIGQLLDRIGVMMSYDFPAGAAMDRAAISGNESSALSDIGSIKTDGLYYHLSGIETQAKRAMDKYKDNDIAAAVLKRVTDMLITVTENAKNQYDIDECIFAGGVSQSNYLRTRLKNAFDDIIFGEPASDNAVGIARLASWSIE